MQAIWRLRSDCWQASRRSVLDELERARVDLLRAQIASEQRRGDDAGRLFMSAASRLEPLDPELARETYLEALGGAMASDVEVAGGAPAVAAAARAAPASTAPPRTLDVVLDAFAIRLTDGYAAAAPTFARALELLLATDIAKEDLSRWLSVSSGRDSNIVAHEMWDDEAVHLLAARRVQVARETGALGHLPFALSFLARSHMLAGELIAAGLVLDEARLIAEATGNQAVVNGPMILAAWRGDEAQASGLIEATSEPAATRRWVSNNYARAVLYNGLGRHDAARDAAWSVSARSDRVRDIPGARVGRGGIQDGRPSVAQVRARVALGANPRHYLRVGGWDRSACPCAAKRGRSRREPVSPIDRAPLRYTSKARARPDSPSLRRVAATRTSSPRRPKAITHRA